MSNVFHDSVSNVFHVELCSAPVIGSRVQPARALIPVNYNHLGAHNELIPVEFTPEKYPKPSFRANKRMIVERRTIYPDFNKAKQTPLYPPYYNAGKYGQTGNDIYTAENDILTGTSFATEHIPRL